jgi:hypothetical protein
MIAEQITTTRWTTCLCTDGEHATTDLGHSIFRAESDAAIIARHTGRHVVPVGDIQTGVAA